MVRFRCRLRPSRNNPEGVIEISKLRVLFLVPVAFVLTACFGPTPPAPPSPSPSATVSVSPSPSVSWTWPPTTACGVERWPVKTGTDSGVSQVNLSAVSDSTIAHMNAIQAPATLPQSSRVAPVEDTVYRIHATLVSFKMESDSDYHLVLSDGSGTMIAEIPDPACVSSKSDPLLPGIENARSRFDARFHPNGSFQTVNVPVTVTGVGFFDFKHGQTGVADNGIELHPVISVEFG